MARKSLEKITMDCIRGMADSILPWIKFTSDLPEDHKSGMVPCLDIQVWISHPGSRRRRTWVRLACLDVLRKGLGLQEGPEG